MAFWGSSLSPEKFIIPAYFALIFPIILFVNFIFVIIWIIFRKWYFLLSLIFILLSYPKIKSVFPVNIFPKTQETADNSFTVMTYNTWMMGSMKKHTEKSPKNVIQYILDNDADIICMQEFSVATNFLTQEDIADIFRKYPHKHIYYKNNRKNRKSGIATFSRYPIIKKETIDYPSQQNAAIFSDIVIGNDTIRLINCHLESNLLTEKDKAIPMELRKNFDAETLSNVTVHLSRKLGTAYKTRAKQAEIVAGYVEKSPYKVMLCGDFNDVPLSYSYTKIKGNMKDAFETLGFGIGNTFHENFYNFRIDYIFYDQNFIPLHFQRDKVKYSDHYPLICKMKINSSSNLLKKEILEE